MTLKKYKKILMSRGIDRDQAEYDRQAMARLKRVAVAEGLDPDTAYISKRIESIVEFRKRIGTTSRRGAIKKRKEWINNCTVV